jgi:hypothetical protein
MSQLNFDATQVQPNDGAFEAVPAGWYNVMIDESEIKPTKGGDGHYLQLRFNILDGQYVGQKLFARLNIHNASPVAQNIAYGQLSAIAHAVGVLQVADSSQLHGRPLKVRVKFRPAEGQYEASNDITSYKDMNHVTNAALPAAGAFAPPAGNALPAPQAPSAPQAPWGGPAPTVGAPAPVQAPAPVTQPWQQPQVQQPWQQPGAAAPAAAPPPQAPAGAPPWANPPAAQPAATAAPAPAFNPNGAVPPWQRPA